MKLRGDGRWTIFAATFAALIVLSTCASAMEVQLAGIRLDSPWVTVLDVFGQPAAIAVPGADQAAAQGGGMGMGAPMGGEMGGMGGMGGPGMMGGMGGPGMMGAPAMGGMGGPMMGGMPGMGGPGGAAMGGGGGGGGGGGYPMWAQPVWVEMDDGEVEWFYQKGDVCIGFVFNPDGYVRVIAVAGETCDYARTALWRPHRYVKLGDDFKRVLYRYGYPDKIEPFTADQSGGGGGGAGPAAGPGGAAPGGGPGAGMPGPPGGMGGPGMGPPGMGGGMPGMGGPEAGGAPGGMAGGGGAGAAALGPISVTFNGQTNSLSRDAVLTYDDANNIAFTLHNMKVTRVHIWKAGR